MKVPFGYTRSNGNLIPNVEDLELLSRAKELVENGVSLRQVRDWINAKASSTISHEGLKKRLSRGVYVHGDGLLSGYQEEI